MGVELRRCWAGSVAAAGFVCLLAYPAYGQDWHFAFGATGNLIVQAAEISAPPQILSQPQTQVVGPGELASFFVVAADTRGLAYQWRFNETNLTGATNDTLLLAYPGATNEGLYSVVLINSSGSVTSAPAALMIDSDGDGLPDSWEIAHFGNLNQTATGDFDHDGVSNLQEFLDGTDPANRASALLRLTVLQDGGSVQAVPSQASYTNGQTVTLIATPIPAGSFHLWTGDVLSRSNSITLVMTNNKTVFAHFMPIDFTWINAAGGDWNVASNWSPGFVPGSNDNAIITIGASIVLNSNADCAGLTFGATGIAPTLSGNATLTAHGICTWTAGTMNGSGRTVIDSGGILTIANPATIYLASRTLENGGTMLWTGAGDFNPSAGAVITNRAGALLNVQNSATFQGAPGVSPRIDNAGTFRKSVSGGTTVFGYGFALNNFGAVDIQSGTLFPASGGFNGGAMQVAAGTTLNLAGFGSSAGSSITGAGNLTISGGDSTLDGLCNVTGTHTISGGTVTYIGNVFCTNNTLNIPGGLVAFSGTGTVAPAVLNLSGGTLDGTMLVAVGNTMSWTGGAMTGTGRTVIPPGVTLTIANPATIYLAKRTLENGGTILWTGAGDINPSAGAVITNRAGALFSVQNSASFLGAPGASPRVDNAGTFRKSVSTGTTAFGFSYAIPLFNYGTVDIQSGVLAANGGYVSSSDAILNCALWGTTPGANYGQLQVPGTVNLDGTLSVSLTNHYFPTTNDTFTVLSAGARNGTFVNFIYPSNSVSMSLSNAASSEIVRVTGVAPQQPTPLSPAPGIISWWRSENDAMDAIGTNHGALTNGATFAAGKVGQSFLLDGINGYVVIPDSPSLRPASVTMEAWVKIFSTNGTELIFAKPLGSGTLDSYGLALVNGVPLAAICDTKGFGTFISSTDPLALGQWYHLAYTFDGTTSQEVLYVNGAAMASANAGKSMDFDTHPLLLGADIENGVPSLFLNGQIDEASLYNRALEASEIASIYNVGSAGKQLGSAYQRWKLVHLKDADAPDLGDPDGDGYATLLEYGLALFPEVADPPGLPQMNLFDYGAGDKRLRTILHRDPTHNDVTIEVQGSSNLVGGWQSLAASTNGLPFQGIGYVGGDGAGLEIKTVEIRDSASITNAPQRFIRVKVTH